MQGSEAFRRSLGAVLIMTAATALLLAQLGAGAQAPEPTPKADTARAADTQNGKRIYTSYGCYQCHGHEGQGSSATGPRIGPRPLPFPAYLEYVRRPTGQMPPYTRKVVSDSELADIYAFLKLLPEPPVAKTIRLLNETN